MIDPWRNYDRWKLESPEDQDERRRKLFAKPNHDDDDGPDPDMLREEREERASQEGQE